MHIALDALPPALKFAVMLGGAPGGELRRFERR